MSAGSCSIETLGTSRKLSADQEKMEIFLTEICPPAWHAPHDRGVSSAVSCAELAAQASHQFSDLIWAWSSGSEEMTGSANAESFEVLRAVRETGLPCYALTNMEAETYPLRLERFAVLGWFDGTVVSGREAIAKPEPAIFTRLLDRFGLTARTTLMIDDSKENLEAAGNLGIQTVLFRSSRLLRAELEAVAVLPRSVGAHEWRRCVPPSPGAMLECAGCAFGSRTASDKSPRTLRANRHHLPELGTAIHPHTRTHAASATNRACDGNRSALVQRPSRWIQCGGVSTIRAVAAPRAFQIVSTSSNGLGIASIRKDPLPISTASPGSMARIPAVLTDPCPLPRK